MLTPIAERWAGELTAARGRPRRYGDPSVAPALLAAAQALPYVSRAECQAPGVCLVDLVDHDLRTVEREGGDCKARSMYLVALCRWYGLAAGLAWIPQRPFPLDHVSAKVCLGGRWRWADATVPGARLGEWPADAARRLSYRGASLRGVHAA